MEVQVPIMVYAIIDVDVDDVDKAVHAAKREFRSGNYGIEPSGDEPEWDDAVVDDSCCRDTK